MSDEQSESPSGRREPFWFGAAALFLVALVAFSFGYTPLRTSQDEWWHLKAGQLIVQGKLSLAGQDPFSYCGQDQAWHNHEWLSQVIFYWFYSLGSGSGLDAGLHVLIAAKAVTVAITFMLVAWLVRRRGAPWMVSAVVGIMMAEVARRTIYPRPPVVSYLLFAIYLLVMHDWKVGRFRAPWLFLLVPLTVLWANMHGMVPLAIVVVGAYWAGELVERVWAARQVGWARALLAAVQIPTIRILTALLALVALATLAQPSGVALYSLAGKFTKDPLLQKTIFEMLPTPFFWRPISGYGWVFLPGYMTAWVVAAALIGLFVYRRGRVHYVADALLAFFVLYQGLMHWRLLPLLAIGAAGPIGYLLTQALEPVNGRRLWRVAGSLAGLLAIVYVGVIGEPVSYLRRNALLASGRSLDDPMSYSRPLANYLSKTKLPDKLYSPSNYCGWFIWWLAPQKHLLFADNRFDHFGSKYLYDEFIIREALTTDALILNKPVRCDWRAMLAEYDIKTIVIERSARLHQALLQTGGFEQVYLTIPPNAPPSDGGWAVWVKADVETEGIRRLALDTFRAENPSASSPAALERALASRP